MKKKVWAFTLAEVLITLGIIGVVAAMTIPTLMQKTNRSETVAAVKKFYANFTNAVKLAEVEKGSRKNWEDDDLKYAIENNLKIAHNCQNWEECFNGPFRYIYKTETIDNDGSIDCSLENSWVLSDGVSLCYDGFSNPNFYVDINGKKGPNRFGEDMFHFNFSEDKPNIAQLSFDCADNTNYLKTLYPEGDCAFGYILKYGNMDYLDN